MISAIRRQIALRRRNRARAPLIALLRACAGHAMAPLAGQDMTPELLDACDVLVARSLARLADAGALAYFGIRDAADLGRPEVSIRVVSADGRVELTVEPLVAWIFAGGARGAGWRSPGQLTADDLR